MLDGTTVAPEVQDALNGVEGDTSDHSTWQTESGFESAESHDTLDRASIADIEGGRNSNGTVLYTVEPTHEAMLAAAAAPVRPVTYKIHKLRCKTLARHIHEVFVRPGAALEVNISFRERKLLESGLEATYGKGFNVGKRKKNASAPAGSTSELQARVVPQFDTEGNALSAASLDKLRYKKARDVLVEMASVFDGALAETIKLIEDNLCKGVTDFYKSDVGKRLMLLMDIADEGRPSRTSRGHANDT